MRPRVRLARRAGATLGVAAVAAAAGAAAFTTPASASVYNCRGGYVSATTAWGTCSNGGGWNGFSLTVQCYYWGANTVYGNAPGTLYASCPSWSHVTRIIVQPAAF